MAFALYLSGVILILLSSG